jgi:hypothetical protein
VFHFPAGGIYPAGCSVQTLLPVHGYQVPPRARQLSPKGGLRMWVVVQMMHPGTYHSLGEAVNYTQQGTRYRDFIAIGFSGSVARNAAWPVVYNEKGCLYKTHLLNPGHG